MRAREPLNRQYLKALKRNDRLANEIAIRWVTAKPIPPKLTADYKAIRVLIHDLIDQGATAHGGVTNGQAE